MTCRLCYAVWMMVVPVTGLLVILLYAFAPLLSQNATNATNATNTTTLLN